MKHWFAHLCMILGAAVVSTTSLAWAQGDSASYDLSQPMFAETGKANVILVVDASGSVEGLWDGKGLEYVQAQLENFITSLTRYTSGNNAFDKDLLDLRVGVVYFDGQAQVIQPLTSNRPLLLRRTRAYSLTSFASRDSEPAYLRHTDPKFVQDPNDYLKAELVAPDHIPSGGTDILEGVKTALDALHVPSAESLSPLTSNDPSDAALRLYRQMPEREKDPDFKNIICIISDGLDHDYDLETILAGADDPSDELYEEKQKIVTRLQTWGRGVELASFYVSDDAEGDHSGYRRLAAQTQTRFHRAMTAMYIGLDQISINEFIGQYFHSVAGNMLYLSPRD